MLVCYRLVSAPKVFCLSTFPVFSRLAVAAATPTSLVESSGIRSAGPVRSGVEGFGGGVGGGRKRQTLCHIRVFEEWHWRQISACKLQLEEGQKTKQQKTPRTLTGLRWKTRRICGGSSTLSYRSEGGLWWDGGRSHSQRTDCGIQAERVGAMSKSIKKKEKKRDALGEPMRSFCCSHIVSSPETSP